MQFGWGPPVWSAQVPPAPASCTQVREAQGLYLSITQGHDDLFLYFLLRVLHF